MFHSEETMTAAVCLRPEPVLCYYYSSVFSLIVQSDRRCMWEQFREV